MANRSAAMLNPLVPEFKLRVVDAELALARTRQAASSGDSEIVHLREALLRMVAESRDLMARADRLLARR